MPGPPDSLAGLVAEELAQPLPPQVAALSEAARRRHPAGSILAVLFYGSCLRSGTFDDKIVDLYLLADSYAAVHPRAAMRRLNALLPPNVYYLEAEHAGTTLRAKYALVTLGQFERLVSERTLHPYFWARFAQPARLAWARDSAARQRVVRAVASAVATTFAAAAPLLPPGDDGLRVWQRAFAESYRTELRAEGPERAAALVSADADRYRRLTRLLAPRHAMAGARAPVRARRRWWRRRRLGKLLSVLRLAKAAFTFEGGADYLMWKIARHSGVRVELTDWQRRHPILAAGRLFWTLYRRGAFR